MTGRGGRHKDAEKGASQQDGPPWEAIPKFQQAAGASSGARSDHAYYHLRDKKQGTVWVGTLGTIVPGIWPLSGTAIAAWRRRDLGGARTALSLKFGEMENTLRPCGPVKHTKAWMSLSRRRNVRLLPSRESHASPHVRIQPPCVLVF